MITESAQVFPEDLTLSSIAEAKGQFVDESQLQRLARYHGDIRRGPEMRAATIDKLLTNCDALRRPQRFEQLLEACACDYHGRLGWENKPMPKPEFFSHALSAARSIDAAVIASSCTDPAHIPERLHSARTAAIKESLELTH